jgi:hypothetical protein
MHWLRRAAPTLAALTLFGLAFVGVDPVLRERTKPGSRDVDLYAAIASRVAGGESYYDVVAEEQPARGYPVRPVFTWRPPTLAWLLAALRSRAAAHLLLWIVGALSVWGWARVLRLRAGAAALVLIAPLWLAFSPLAVYMHELWAGQLIALGLASWLRGRAGLAVAALLTAALIREHAILALVMVAIASWRRGQPVVVWGVALALVVAAMAGHAVAVAQHTPPEGLANPWGGKLGWAFFVSSIQSHVLLMAPPYWVAAATAAVTVPALWMWREGRLVAEIVTAYALVFCLVARPDNWYWGLLIVPLLPLGCIALIRQRLARQPREEAAAGGR